LNTFHRRAARGLGGQYIFCFSELDMVVVTIATGSLLNTYPRLFEGMFNLS